MGVKTNILKAELAVRGLNYVGFRGSPQSPVLILGEAPGAEEDQQGFPFVGSSGKLLDRMLASAGFGAVDVWFTNPYQARPPNNDLEKLPSLGVPFTVYEDAFFEQLEETKPTFIIACGAVGLSVLCPETRDKKTGKATLGKWRGSLLSSRRLAWPHYIMPVYHPAFILREWSEHDTNAFFLRKAYEEFVYWRSHGKLQPLPERELIVTPTADQCIDYLQSCLAQGRRGIPTSVDIELFRRRIPYVCSFALSPTSAISVPLWDYNDVASVRIWRLMDELFRSCPQIGQNYTSFDMHWLYHLGFGVNPFLVHDTRIRHNILWPELPHKLEFMVAQYTREPYYKDEGRGWTRKDGIAQLQRYNCKDTTCTYEVFNEQEKEFDERPELKAFYAKHEKKLASHMFNIERRGVAVDPSRLQSLRKFIESELDSTCGRISTLIGKPANVPRKPTDKLAADVFNINSPQQVITILKSRGLKIPKNRMSGKETTGEEHLNELFAETGDKLLKEILDVRELVKIKGTYVDCITPDNTLYCVYIVGGTVGGRRSSRANPLGFGTNHQNQPKHSKLGRKFRQCIVARSGKILIQCDQMAAEDWIINGIIADESGDKRGLDELRSGIDRHQRLASFIFGQPLDQCSRTAPTIFRYVGKRTRYAGSYGMGGNKFAAVLAKEGYSLPKEHCNFLLQKFHEYDPGIKGVFQPYIERQLGQTRTLRDLFGRERQFFGLNPYRDNSKIFREAYSYIPQSTIGDNNGAAVNFIEDRFPGYIVMEVHDAIVIEVNDTLEDFIFGVRLLQRSYDRILTFPHGLKIQIPIEIEVGYDLKDMFTCDSLAVAGLKSTFNTLQQHRSHQSSSISGAQQLASVQP